MGRYDDDDSEYVVYGNMSSAVNGKSAYEKLKEFKKIFTDKYAKSDVSLDEKTTTEIEQLAELLNKISEKKELTSDDKKLMVGYGAPEILLKEDVTYNDIKELPEFEGLSECIGTMSGSRIYDLNGETPEQVKETDIAFFSVHKQIASEFYKSMEDFSKQDNDKSLYLRLTMMTKYHQFGYGFCRYENPQRRLNYMKTYLAVYENSSVSNFLGHSSTDKIFYRHLSDLVTGISPADAKDILQKGALEEINILWSDNSTRIGNQQELLPYLMEIIKDDKADGNLREDLITVMAHWIEENHYSGRSRKNCGKGYMQAGWSDVPYTEQEKLFYDYIDNTLLQRADLAVKNGDLELLVKISDGIEMRIDEMNPQTKKLTDNQILFYEKYILELVKNQKFEVPAPYLEVASEWCLNLAIEYIKYSHKRYNYNDYFEKHQISLYDASDFATLIRGGIVVDSKGEHYINYMDKLPSALNEGFWINTTKSKIKTYNEVCIDIYNACTPPLDDEKKSKIREVGESLLQKLTKEYPLEEKEIDKLDNKSLLVLTYTGDVKGREIKIESGKNKIDQKLLQAGLLKLSTRTQVDRSPVSKYCDINEIWVDEGFFGCKTNLLDAKLRRGAVNDVIDLINRGANVSVKVERSNRDNQKFPISPFDRYISGILYRGKWHVIEQLGEDMQKIAREVNLDKLFAVNKIFGSLSYKTRNDERVRYIEKQVNQIISERNPKLLGKDGKSR